MPIEKKREEAKVIGDSSASECLPHKHEDLSLILRIHVKKYGKIVCALRKRGQIAGTCELALGKWELETDRLLGPAS